MQCSIGPCMDFGTLHHIPRFVAPEADPTCKQAEEKEALAPAALPLAGTAAAGRAALTASPGPCAQSHDT